MGQVCASRVGRRKERGLRRLPALVAPFGITLFSTDGWGPSERHGDTEHHAGGKEPRQRMERAPITWRTRLPRCVRRMICFSQTERMHDLVIGPLINRYACRRAIEYERHNAAPLAFSGYLPHEDLTALGTRMTHISVLDLSLITEGGDAATALSNTRDLAQHAEAWGYRRYWVAEHHNMPGIASAATAVVIGHVASGTSTIRVGAGGIMLPNHAPLTIAEQFGTLAELHPGRIDLGLGRAPGSDQITQRALRRDPMAAERFPQDVMELEGYLSGMTRVPGVEATPGKGTAVPLYILGSSLFGASLAAALGLPFAFASHFAPGALEEAIVLYRREFKPLTQLDSPYVIAGVNVVAADTADEAEAHLLYAQRRRVARFVARGHVLTDDEADELLASPAGQQLLLMMEYTAVGDPLGVKRYLDEFARHTAADELIVTLTSPTLEARLRSATILAEVAALPAA